MAARGGVSRWTRFFVVASAISMVAVQAILLAGGARGTVVIIGLFGAILPMVFGMAYLLLPAYVGQTLSSQWLPGINFGLVYLGVGVFLVQSIGNNSTLSSQFGSFIWASGVVVFLLVIGWTVVPTVVRNPEIVIRSEDRPQRSTRLATATIPVAVGYLLIGTIALLSTAGLLPDLVGATVPQTVHYYTTGFVTLLIFSLGARLMIGFFHVTPPRYTTWLVLSAGMVAPAMLAWNFWHPPWFWVAAGLELIALVGYAGLVGNIAYRTDRRRAGLHGIVLGSLFGVGGALLGVLIVVGHAPAGGFTAHVVAMINGFVLLTIIGYAYQFFPVTNGQFPGATRRVALTSIYLSGTGIGLRVLGSLTTRRGVLLAGSTSALVGTIVYAYLIVQRLVRDA